MDNKKEISIPKGMDLNRVRKLRQLEEALLERADFRYNVLTRFPEVRFKPVNGRTFHKWHRLNDYILNSLAREISLEGVPLANRNKIGELIESTFAKRRNPIHDYFKELPPVVGDPIGELASTVVALSWPGVDETPEQLFKKYLQKWLVGAVANAFILDACANQICLIISGRQGCFKSTWIRNLCPPGLKQYYIEGSLDPDNKDSILATATNFIFNLDDYFAGITSKKINEFKGLLTKNMVKIRRAYARYNEELPKICSFIASSNEGQFLHDQTGNRRFVAFEVESIDIEKAKSINMDAVWSQAYQLYKSGEFVYWMEEEDMVKLNSNNNKFEVQTNEYEALNTWFKPPKEGELPEADLTNTDILSFLQEKVNMKLSSKKLGEALRKMEFPRYQKSRNSRRSWVYGIIYADEADINIGRQPSNNT